MVVGPACEPATGIVASPPTALAVAGRPATVPEPDVCVSVIAAELEATLSPVASRTATVRLRELPEASGAVELVKARCVATGVTVNALESGVRPDADAVTVTGPGVTAVTV